MSTEATKSLIVTSEDFESHKRLDQYLTEQLHEFSRNQIKSFFNNNLFSAKLKLELKKMPPAGTEIIFNLPTLKETQIEPQDIPLHIIYEDEHLIVLNKPAGLVVHPAPGNWDGTLVNALLFHCKDLKGIGHEKRPGIVHRLDKGTSGIMVAAKSHLTHQGLIELFSKHNIRREYQALVIGRGLEQFKKVTTTIGRSPNNRLKMQTDVNGGKEAITYFNLKESFENIHHINCKLETGRTHQIRVHCSQVLNHPILMDPLYSNTKQHLDRIPPDLKILLADYSHPLLHARLLGFIHPITKKELLFTQEPPNPFNNVLDILRQH